MKIVKVEEGREDMHSNAKRIAYNSVVKMLNSGESGKLEIWDGEITTKPVPEKDLKPSL